MNYLIKNIQREAISNRWANNKGAQFEYNTDDNHYRLIETTPDLQSYLVGITQRNDTNCPVIAKGFVAYLIRNWGNKEINIYNGYYANCFSKFERSETKKPGSFQRDLNAEFFPQHILQEQEYVTFSEKIHPYLSKTEIELINQFVISYFKYIEWVIPQKNRTKENSPDNKNKNKLSVPDWCIIFYYLDEAGNRQGAKIERMVKFIADNDIRNSNGKLTTKNSFKKQYYEICHRINSTEDYEGERLPPLPPERIKNILHYLKKNKKALQTAKNDIIHLNNEIKEHKKYDY